MCNCKMNWTENKNNSFGTTFSASIGDVCYGTLSNTPPCSVKYRPLVLYYWLYKDIIAKKKKCLFHKESETTHQTSFGSKINSSRCTRWAREKITRNTHCYRYILLANHRQAYITDMTLALHTNLTHYDGAHVNTHDDTMQSGSASLNITLNPLIVHHTAPYLKKKRLSLVCGPMVRFARQILKIQTNCGLLMAFWAFYSCLRCACKLPIHMYSWIHVYRQNNPLLW